MFRRSRQVIGTDNQTRPVATIGNNATKDTISNAEVQQQTVKEITNELLTKAWTSFALKLPENERALADRMKIIIPSMDGNDVFSISVDNQMAAELFEHEAKRICKGMEHDLDGRNLKMRVTVNKVVVERHISDKGKQFEILKEKNPLIEKLRQELTLELLR